jgi:GNAT superfamily N-acetyltransferase
MTGVTVETKPLTPDCWSDFADLFRSSAVTSSCWCMWPRVSAGEMRARTADENQRAIQAMVATGNVLGLLAYQDGEAVGWCSVGPLADCSRFAGSDDGAWLVSCLFVRGSARGRGVGRALLDAAVAFAQEHGAVALEGPPRGWRPDDAPGSLQGVYQSFRAVGFRETDDARAPALMRIERQPRGHAQD